MRGTRVLLMLSMPFGIVLAQERRAVPQAVAALEHLKPKAAAGPFA
ncbi:MAG TPA: hypothetical protein VGR02_11755 [Thermoanaerobaculia bacterium]|jgi:hypothetical protein|nr:hypothetical protein [Thermoanaerobaculia bacterium]